MTIDGKVHCFFEQSGTFKNEFIKLGIPAEDYDIQNNFGQTDHVVDLFKHIEDAYDGKPSLFDGIGNNDFIIAFFPCIMFCGISQMNMTLACFRESHKTIKGAGEYILKRSDERQRFLTLLMKMCFVCIDRDIRMVFENPYSSNTYLKNGFLKSPDVIDNDRTNRGDYLKKPTAYWFFNCTPCHGESYEKTPAHKRKYILMHASQHKKHDSSSVLIHKSKTGVCDQERSMMSPDYARNFICDFILGGGQTVVKQQLDFFD